MHSTEPSPGRNGAHACSRGPLIASISGLLAAEKARFGVAAPTTFHAETQRSRRRRREATGCASASPLRALRLCVFVAALVPLGWQCRCSGSALARPPTFVGADCRGTNEKTPGGSPAPGVFVTAERSAADQGFAPCWIHCVIVGRSLELWR